MLTNENKNVIIKKIIQKEGNKKMEKTEKQTGYRARPVAYNVKTSYAERETIKKTIVEIKKANDFKSETDALLYLVNYYEKTKKKD